MDRHLFWSAVRWPGFEHLRIRTNPTGTRADGLVIAALDSGPVRVGYLISCDSDWRTRRVRVKVLGASGGLSINSDGAGHWLDADGRSIPSIEGCHDIDIAITPFTNTLPIRRLQLRPGQTRDMSVAYVALPGLTLRATNQRYTCLEEAEHGATYRYESGTFRADLRVDSDGFVIDYPGVWLRADPGGG